jgi:hypothetical protein
MKDLLVHVERIVRPIEAMNDRKDRMREELLAHLVTRFEQERAKTSDDALAAQKAIAGLGDPHLLGAEMQDSVSRTERFKARIERLLGWRAPEPAWRYTLRSGAFVCGIFVVLLPIAMLFLFAVDSPAASVVLRLMLSMGVLTGVNVFVLGWLYFKTRDNLLQAFGSKRSWFRLLGYFFASAVTIEGSLLFFLWATTEEFATDLSILMGRSLVALVLPASGFVVAWFRGPAELRHTFWECLDIRENPPPAVAE